MNARYFLTLFLLTSISFLSAQNTRHYTTQRTETAPHINGIFDDEPWQQAVWQGEFTQYDPENNGAPSEKTEFAILYDDDNLYVGIKAYDSEPEKIESRLTRRDGWEGDLVGIHFDSYFDKLTTFAFMASAAGVKNDGFMSNDDSDSFDDTWDPIWELKTKVHSEGWNAEMKIPLSQLRFGEKEKQVWGLQVGRNIFRKDEWSLWQHIDNEASGWVSLYGELHGIDNIKPRKQIEIAPFVVADAQIYEEEEGNPFADGEDFGINAGVDGKIGLTNDLILDFAINPDFGQVEADPSEVNLSAFESFFEEKRPFFIEGSNITNFQITGGGSPWSSDNLFYSRRLGRRPHGDPELGDDEYAKIPNNTKILGALKLTGKTQKGWSIGIVESITNREKATIDHNGDRRKENIEPLTNYFVARLQKDINKGNTVIGGMFTSTFRDIENPDLLFLPKSALTGGVDFIQFFKNKKYFVSSNFVASKVNGDKEAILDLQESSRRYYQRPDADYLTLDPNRTSLSGTGGSFMAGKISNNGLRYVGNITFRSPGVELNDVGFLRQGNTVFQYIWLGYQINKPFSIFRSMSINSNQWAGWDSGGTNLFKGGNINFNTQFKNFWELGFNVNREGQGLSNTSLRGGPSIIEMGNWNYSLNFNSNSRKKLQVGAGVNVNENDKDSGRNLNFWLDANYRPFNSLSISMESSFGRYENILQYVDQIDFEGETRYLFSNIDQKTFNLTLTVDYSITPDLSIQYYGSPFVSGGTYTDFKKITDSHAAELSDRYHLFSQDQIHYNEYDEIYFIDELMDGTNNYSFEKPDFNFRQFRSNLVMRWEYTPGSTIFLVWSSGKTDDVSNGDFDLRNDLKDLSKTKGREIFLVKFSYRFRAEQWQ